MNQNYLWICASTHYLLHYFKFLRNSVEHFQELRWQTVFSNVSLILVKFLRSKRALLREKKNWIKISCGYAHLHIMSFIITKFHEIQLSGFRGAALSNCFSSIFHFGQISKFKRGVTPRKKKTESKFPVDMYIYTLCPS